MIVISPTEKEVLIEAIILLRTATCNSLNPIVRQGWVEAQARVLQRLEDITR